MKRYYVPPIMRAIDIDTQGLIAQSNRAGGTLQDFRNSSAFGKGNNNDDFNNSDAFGSNSLGNFNNQSAW